jgi:ribose 5-phosphate isomerase A
LSDDRDVGKRRAAEAALEYLEPGTVVGVGTGSTANLFIDLLAAIQERFDGALASSRATEERLRGHGVRVLDPADTGRVPVYVDGADEADPKLRLIKGGGGALTREKVLAGSADRFVCVVDDSKLVETLGRFPLPVEVIPMALGHVTREIEALGGRPLPREGFVTDNGNAILDVHDLAIERPEELEGCIDGIAGVVTNGLFAVRPADVLLVGSVGGLRTLP